MPAASAPACLAAQSWQRPRVAKSSEGLGIEEIVVASTSIARPSPRLPRRSSAVSLGTTPEVDADGPIAMVPPSAATPTTGWFDMLRTLGHLPERFDHGLKH